MKKFIPIVMLGAMVACSGGAQPTDEGLSDAPDAVAPDSIQDVAGDAAGDEGVRLDVDAAGDESPVDVNQDVVDAGGDAVDDVPEEVIQGPWYENLAPAGQKLREIFGIASHMDTTEAGDAETEWEFDQYDALGGVRARRGFRWSNIEPNEGEWHWEKTNGAVTRSAEHGVKLLPVVYYGNDWAQTDPEAYGTLDVSKYAYFAGQMATQYCASIKEYELWNEQNITRFWGIDPDPAMYAEMVVAASQAIKAACPDARVGFGGMASYDDVAMFDTWNYLRRALAARPDLCDYFEIVALHPYTFIQYDSPEYDEVDYDFQKPSQTRMTEIARHMLADAGCGDKDIYYTELGWPSYDLTREQIASYAVRSMLLAARDGVDGWYWYTFYDDDPTSCDSIRPHECYFGLWEWTGDDMSNHTPKPAWNDLVSMLGRAGDGRFAGEVSRMLDLPEDVYVLAFVDDADNLVLAMWDGRNQPDMTYGAVGEGGPSTTYDLVLPLPGSAVATTLYNQQAVEVASPGIAPTLNIQLTPSVQYLVIDRGTTL